MKVGPKGATVADCDYRRIGHFRPDIFRARRWIFVIFIVS
jgi:hypothetical protein